MLIPELAAPCTTPWTDCFARPITYLRLSVTDRCNLRCRYCLPALRQVWLPHRELLTPDEIARIARAARRHGVRKVRLTGGEPLVRPDLPELLAELRRIGFEELCLTTNGWLFPAQAAELRAAGLDRVNFSLDTLRPDRYAALTQGGDVGRVLEAVDVALELGLQPRLNVVLLRGVNDDELADLAALTLERPLTVRFIELMPFTGGCASREGRPMLVEDAAEALGVELPRLPGSPLGTRGPASYLRMPGAQGEVGFIAAMHEHLCQACNRVRLTADGQLRACLLGDVAVDLRSAARAGDDSAIDAGFRQLLWRKPRCGQRDQIRNEPLAAVGG